MTRRFESARATCASALLVAVVAACGSDPWLKAQDEFAATLTPDARHVLADTGHFVHVDDPDLVVGEIRALIARTEH